MGTFLGLIIGGFLIGYGIEAGLTNGMEKIASAIRSLKPNITSDK